jgi:hypothetical protein
MVARCGTTVWNGVLKYDLFLVEKTIAFHIIVNRIEFV